MDRKKLNIAVVSPSGRVDKAKVKTNVHYLRNLGHTVTTGEYIFEEYGPFAGIDDNRLKDLQWAFDGDFDLIWMSRGGYGLGRIIDRLRFDKFSNNPKTIIGYSDITAAFLDQRLFNTPMIHATMLEAAKKEDIDRVLNLFYSGHIDFSDAKCDNDFEIEGKILGGNLSLLISQIGLFDLDIFENNILVLEEINEYDYKIDRMLNQLKRLGIFKRCQAVFLGAFENTIPGNTPISDFSIYMQGMVKKESNLLVSNLEIGHINHNYPLFLNRKCRIEYKNQHLSINYNV